VPEVVRIWGVLTSLAPSGCSPCECSASLQMATSVRLAAEWFRSYAAADNWSILRPQPWPFAHARMHHRDLSAMRSSAYSFPMNSPQRIEGRDIRYPTHLPVSFKLHNKEIHELQGLDSGSTSQGDSPRRPQEKKSTVINRVPYLALAWHTET
jgi:hypothetical protein